MRLVARNRRCVGQIGAVSEDGASCTSSSGHSAATSCTASGTSGGVRGRRFVPRRPEPALRRSNQGLSRRTARLPRRRDLRDDLLHCDRRCLLCRERRLREASGGGGSAASAMDKILLLTLKVRRDKKVASASGRARTGASWERNARCPNPRRRRVRPRGGRVGIARRRARRAGAPTAKRIDGTRWRRHPRPLRRGRAARGRAGLAARPRSCARRHARRLPTYVKMKKRGGGVGLPVDVTSTRRSRRPSARRDRAAQRRRERARNPRAAAAADAHRRGDRAQGDQREGRRRLLGAQHRQPVPARRRPTRAAVHAGGVHRAHPSHGHGRREQTRS